MRSALRPLHVLIGALTVHPGCGDDGRPAATGAATDADGTNGTGPDGSSGGGSTGEISTTSGGSTTGSTGSTAGGGSDGTSSGSTGGGTSSGTGGGAGALAIYMVGNSYTAANDLAGLVTEVGDSLGWTITAQAHAPGGARFGDHLANPTVTDTIATGAFDFVTLQGQSVETIHPALSASAYTDGVALGGLVAGAGMVAVFFETWPRAEGHVDYQDAWSGGTPAAMAALTHDAYSTIATDAGAGLAPVGQAFMDIVANEPAIDLYVADGSHPSVHGSYLGACVFFSIFTGETSVGAAAPAAISADDALVLQEAAEAAVFP